MNMGDQERVSPANIDKPNSSVSTAKVVKCSVNQTGKLFFHNDG